MASGEFNRVLQTTIAEYLLDAEDNVIRNRKFLALMKAKGRISFNHSGTNMDWGIQWRRRNLVGYADGDVVQFARSDLFRRANLPWRGYVMSDFVTDKEKLMNRDKPQLIKVYSELVESMNNDMTDRYHTQLYIDGEAAGNSKLIHGLESFMSGTTPAGSSLSATPNDTYGGISTAPANYGGSWTGAWPAGQGDPEYDFWSPVLVDYTNTNWTATTKTWPNTCVEALRYGIIKGKRNDSQKGMIDIVLLDGELYRQWEAVLDTKERIFVQIPNNAMGARPTLRNLGFGDTQAFEGAEVTWEFGVPTNASGDLQGYGLNIDEMELCVLDDRIFKPLGPYYDEASMSERFMIRQFGNMRFNPRYFVKWGKYT